MRKLQRIIRTAMVLGTIVSLGAPYVVLAGEPVNSLYSNPSDPLTSIVPDAVHQGQIGDCYFLAAVGSLASINPQAILNMIKDNGDGTYTVTFAGASDEPITVSAPTPDELKNFARGSEFGYWVPVLEKAYGAYCNKHFWRRAPFNIFGGDTANQGADGGSLVNAGLSILTTGGVTSDSTTFSRYSTISDRIEKALTEKRPVTLGTSCLKNTYGLPKQHEYSVLSFTPNGDDLSKGTLLIYNPHGDGPGAGLNGSSLATFQMTLEEVCKTFNEVSYADKPVTSDAPGTPSTAHNGTPNGGNASGAATGTPGTAGDGQAGNGPTVAVTPVVNKPYVSNIQNDEGYMPLLKSMIKTQETSPDGTRTTDLTDGTHIVEKRDGYKYMKFENGKEYEDIPGVSQTWIEPDGTKLIRYPDNTEVTIFPSGTKLTVKPDGTKIREPKPANTDPKVALNEFKTEATNKSNVQVAVNNVASEANKSNVQVAVNNVEDEAAKGNISVALKGDGVNTSHVTLLLTNNTAREEYLTVPKYECFMPSKSGMQIMMASEKSPTLDIAPGKTLATEIPSVCVSTKTLKPPVFEPIAYTPGAYPDETQRRVLQAIIDASQTLDQKKAFDNSPIAPERRAHTVAQLAIWSVTGAVSPNPADVVNKDVVKADICNSANLDPTKLAPPQKKQLDDSIAKIMAGVDLTLKQAHNLANDKHHVAQL